MSRDNIILAVSLLVSLATTFSRQIGCLVETVFVAFVSRLAMLATRTLVLSQVGRDNATMVREKVITVVDARTRAMLLFIKWLYNTVAHFSLLVLRSVLLFDFFIKLHKVLLSLLFLVLLHELLEHLLGSLLPLLPDILFDKLVHTAQFLLLLRSGGPFAAPYIATACLAVCLVSSRAFARSLLSFSTLPFALASLGSFLGPLISTRPIAIDKGLFDKAVKLRLICLARQDATQVVILVTLQCSPVNILADLRTTRVNLLRGLRSLLVALSTLCLGSLA